jgi:hypothetical protein
MSNRCLSQKWAARASRSVSPTSRRLRSMRSSTPPIARCSAVVVSTAHPSRRRARTHRRMPYAWRLRNRQRQDHRRLSAARQVCDPRSRPGLERRPRWRRSIVGVLLSRLVGTCRRAPPRFASFPGDIDRGLCLSARSRRAHRGRHGCRRVGGIFYRDPTRGDVLLRPRGSRPAYRRARRPRPRLNLRPLDAELPCV